MRPEPEFRKYLRPFWAQVRLISERLGYSERAKGKNKVKLLRRYTLDEILECLKEAELRVDHLISAATGRPTEVGENLVSYLNFRAELLEKAVEPNLMNREEAKAEFNKLREKLSPTCALPKNKQKGEKSHYAYMTGIVNMLTCEGLGTRCFVDSPRGLVVVTRDRRIVRTFARWMDGAYPSIVDPHAVWEVKEYYGTTTFGSRVADGVYETMLDGEELAECEKNADRKVLHYLIVDDRFTWWECGRSYLCRIVDMLHMGLVDEVLFGREVLTRWPEIVKSWP